MFPTSTTATQTSDMEQTDTTNPPTTPPRQRRPTMSRCTSDLCLSSLSSHASSLKQQHQTKDMQHFTVIERDCHRLNNLRAHFTSIYELIDSQDDFEAVRDDYKRRFDLFTRYDRRAQRLQEAQRTAKMKGSRGKEKFTDAAEADMESADPTGILQAFTQLRDAAEKLVRHVGSMQLRWVPHNLEVREWAWGIYALALGYVTEEEKMMQRQRLLKRFLQGFDKLPDTSSENYREMENQSRCLWLALDPKLADVGLLYIVGALQKWEKRMQLLESEKKTRSRSGSGSKSKSRSPPAQQVEDASTVEDLQVKLPDSGYFAADTPTSTDATSLPAPKLDAPSPIAEEPDTNTDIDIHPDIHSNIEDLASSPPPASPTETVIARKARLQPLAKLNMPSLTRGRTLRRESEPGKKIDLPLRERYGNIEQSERVGRDGSGSTKGQVRFELGEDEEGSRADLSM